MLAALLGSVLLAVEVPSAPASAEDLKTYQEAASRAGRDAEAHVKLALWCERHGLVPERLKQLALAVLIDPGNVAARGLLGLVEEGGKWRRPEAVTQRARDDAERAATLAEYNGRRARLKNTADAHWRLAVWCDEHDLKPEAMAHYSAVTRLDPSRAAAWKRLGCKKYHGRWMSESQIAASKANVEAQKKADKFWRPTLASLKAALSSRATRGEAERKLAAVDDPRATRWVWRIFAQGVPADQLKAVQLFGQIDAPGASRALAVLALYCPAPEVRQAAIETLRRRDPRDYLGASIALLLEPLKFQVRPVGGPGTPGALFVEGEKFRDMRVYAPPALQLPFLLGPVLATDPEGYAIYQVPGQVTSQSRDVVARFSGQDIRQGLASGSDPRAGMLAMVLGNHNPTQARNQYALQIFKPGLRAGFNPNFVKDSDFDVAVTETTTTTRQTTTTIPIGRIMAEYEKSAIVAEKQLENDLMMVQRTNVMISESNDRVLELLSNVSGQSLGPDRDDWMTWWNDQLGYEYTPPPPMLKPTFVEDVPLAYLPMPIAPTTAVGPVTREKHAFDVSSQPTTSGLARMARFGLYPECFAAGTPVRTRDGIRKIEEVRVGDLVLSQDTATGALLYRPVLTLYRFRPTATVRLVLDKDELVITPVHKFWKAGKGWTMARDLKAGDPIRTLGGLTHVVALEPDQTRPIFDLQVAETADFFAGHAAVLSRDYTPTGPREIAFDAAPELAQRAD